MTFPYQNSLIVFVTTSPAATTAAAATTTITATTTTKTKTTINNPVTNTTATHLSVFLYSALMFIYLHVASGVQSASVPGERNFV